MRKQNSKPKKSKQGKNKGKKYEKPLSLYGMNFEQVVEIALKYKNEQKK